MFGKRRDKQDELDKQFESPKPPPAYSGPLMGAMRPSQLPAEPPAKPLYGGDPTPEPPGETASRVTDDAFAANLEADLNAPQPLDEPDPMPEPLPDPLAQTETPAGPVAESAQEPVEAPAPPVAPAASPARAQRGVSRDGDQMLGLLSTIESQLGELQRLKADREMLVGDLELAREELDAQQALLDQRELNIASLEAEAKENQRITEGMLADAEQRTKELEQRSTDLEQTRNELEQQRVHLDELQRALDERTRELEVRDADMRARIDDLDSREKESEEREAELRLAIEAEMQERLGEVQSALDKARAELEAMRSQVEERNAEIERIRTEADERVAEVEHALREELAARIESEKLGAGERVEQLQSELDEANLALKESADAADAHEAKCRELAERVGQLESELGEAREKASERGDELASGMESVQQRMSQLEGELAKTRDQLTEAGRHLGEAQDRVSAAEQRAKAAESEATTQKQTAEEAKALAAKQAKEHAEKLAEEVAQAKAQAVAQTQAGSVMPPAAPVAPGITPAELAKRDRVIELLKSKLDQTTERCKQLDAQLQAGSPSAPASGANDAGGQKSSLDELQQKLLNRQQELDVIAHKLSAREQAIKQREASAGTKGGPAPISAAAGSSSAMIEAERDALRQENEKIHQQREAIAEAKAKLDRTAQKVAAKAAKGKAANIMLAAMITMVILAASSWYIVGQIAKPIHVASVELGVDPQARLSEQQLRSWQSYHEALLDDPQFHELAARRLKARGYHDFGTPSDVRSMVQSGMITHESSHAGRLILLYTGAGSDRTTRVLDTFSSALSSFANDTRDHRHDGAATAIITQVSADPTPIEDPRLNMFAMVFGGLCAFALFASVVLWRRMSKDMSDFDARLSDDLHIAGEPGEGGASAEGKRLMF